MGELEKLVEMLEKSSEQKSNDFEKQKVQLKTELQLAKDKIAQLTNELLNKEKENKLLRQSSNDDNKEN